MTAHDSFCGQDGEGGCTCAPVVRVTAAQVSSFVDENYQGVYMTWLSREGADGNRLYKTTLHSPDGPIVWTAVRPDGSMLDVTRKPGV